MAILVDQNTKVLVQGMTGWAGTHYTHLMIDYGTNVVAGVRPGKGGRKHLDVPVFDTVAEAVATTQANASAVFVPPATAAIAMIEAIEAEIPLVVCVTESVPMLDMLRVKAALKGSRTRLVGPNSHGILVPGVCKIGVMPTGSGRRGSIGIASRSASLTSEVVAQVSANGLGQSTTVGVGGDPIHGIGLLDCLKLFLEDDETEGIILIGEIGGSEEEECARYLMEHGVKKPVVGLVVGRHAPAFRRMGHAGAIAQRQGDAQVKIATLTEAGVRLAPNAHMVGETMRRALQTAHQDHKVHR